MTFNPKQAKEFVKSKYPNNKWQFITYLIQTKEGHWIIIGIFFLAALFFLTNPEVILKFKIALWNMLLNKMKG